MTTKIAPIEPAQDNGTSEVKVERYHGITVLPLHVDDPIPAPRAPMRYAVRVYPDLARYLLTFNHPLNRKRKTTQIAKYARDMESGVWAFTPEPIIYSSGRILQNGQNRLAAVELAGVSVWLMFDFGWPDDLIERIDRGSARTNADAFTVNGIGNSTVASAAIGIREKYRNTRGTPLRWMNRVLTASEALALQREDPAGWDTASQWGYRCYQSTMGLGPSTWAAAFYIITEARGLETGERFFAEVIEETGEPGSATRKLKSHYLRRRLSDTSSGDSREPMENIIRAFNAWDAGKAAAFVRTGGAFVLSNVRKR